MSDEIGFSLPPYSFEGGGEPEEDPKITFQGDQVVMRNSRIGTDLDCCCDELCGECKYPRQITLTLSGIGNNFCYGLSNGGFPGGDGTFFAPACDEPDGFVWRAVGQAFGPPRWIATSFRNPEEPILLEYDPSSGCAAPRWTGTFPSGVLSANDSGQQPAFCDQDYRSASVMLFPVNPTISVAFTASYGEGAAASVTEVDESTGAITEITLSSGGSGYAFLETVRVEPTVEAAVVSAGGSGAELSVTLEQSTDFNGDDIWSVKSVSVDKAGSGYQPDDGVLFTVTDGEEVWGAWAAITLDRQEPTLGVTVSTSAGTGAEFSVALTADIDFEGNDVWRVDSVAVTKGGSGYELTDTASIDADGAVEVAPATITLELVRAEPQVEAAIVSFGAGSGAVLSVTLNETTDFNGRPAWEVSSVAVDDGGSGYDQFDYLEFTVTSGTTLATAWGVVNVSEAGEVESVSVFSGGLYYDTTGVVDAVTVSGGGEYYATNGSVTAVTVFGGGEYYKLQFTGNVITDVPNVTISSNIGVDATATATVDSDPDSPTFGQVTAVTITDGGENYRLSGQYKRLVMEIPFACVVAAPLAGYVEPASILCEGESLAPFLEEEGVLASRTFCGRELLSKTYNMMLTGGSRGDPIVSVPAGAVYSVRDAFGFCVDVRILDTGSGQITCAIAPA